MKVSGRFFERKEMTAGTMGTVKVHYNELHYFIKEKDDGEISVEMLTKSGKSSGMEVEAITKEEFAERFHPCAEHDCPYVQKSPEEIRKEKLENIENTAEKHLENKEYVSAEFEFGKALKMDEESVRSNYGMGQVYLETGRVEEARKIFKKLSSLDALFEKENKHIFNDFGIDLRKQEMYEEAIANYKKAISIDRSDYILFYNLGRAFKEKGDFVSAVKCIRKAILVKPDFSEAVEYLPFLEAKAKQQGAGVN